jgi:hypothetical protein
MAVCEPRRRTTVAEAKVTSAMTAKNTVIISPTVDNETPNARLIASVAGPTLPPP